MKDIMQELFSEFEEKDRPPIIGEYIILKIVKYKYDKEMKQILRNKSKTK